MDKWRKMMFAHAYYPEFRPSHLYYLLRRFSTYHLLLLLFISSTRIMDCRQNICRPDRSSLFIREKYFTVLFVSTMHIIVTIILVLAIKNVLRIKMALVIVCLMRALNGTINLDLLMREAMNKGQLVLIYLIKMLI